MLRCGETFNHPGGVSSTVGGEQQRFRLPSMVNQVHPVLHPPFPIKHPLLCHTALKNYHSLSVSTSQQYNYVTCLQSSHGLSLLFVPGAEAGNQTHSTTHKIIPSLEKLLDEYCCGLVLLLRTKKSFYVYLYAHVSICPPPFQSILGRHMNEKKKSYALP